MRLTSVTLHRYGNYEAERISFSPAAGKVNILLAANSAGKSVLRNALSDLLFGIHDRTEMGFRYGYNGMRISAEIMQSDNRPAAFVRRKTRGNALTGLDEQPLDPGFLHGILAGRDRKLLERLFVLDTEGLRGGATDLLQSGGDVASALLAAAGGIRQARALKAALERKRDELAPERRTASRPFYQALEKFLDARRRITAATIRPDAWFRQQQQLDELEERRRQQNASADAASVETARLQRIRRVRRWLAQLSDARAWLETHKDAPQLGADIRQALDRARLDVATKAEAARLAGEAFDRAARNAADVTVNAELLACAEQIKQLVDAAGGARTAREDLPGRRAEHDFCMARIRDLLRQLGSDLQPERAAEALPTRASITRTRRRITEHAEFAATAQNAPAQIAARMNELAELDRKLAELPPSPDLRALEVLLAEIRAGGDPTQRRAETEAALAEIEAAQNAALAKVPGWSRGVDALAALAPPAMDVWRRLDADLSAKRAEVTASQGRVDNETDKLEQARNDLTILSRGGTIPDDEAVARSRSHRDAGWRLIYRRAFTPDPPSSAEEQAFARDVPLPLAFERAVANADTVVDRRLADSELSGRIEAARGSVIQSERRVLAAKERLRLSEEAFSQSRRAWVQLCGAIDQPENAALADIQTFLNARDQVIDTQERRATAARAHALLSRRQREWADALAASLGEPLATLPVLVGLGDRILARAREQDSKRREFETLRAKAAKEVQDSMAARQEAEERLAAWQNRWRETLVELGRPETEEPAETETVLQTIGDIAKEHGAASALAERIAGMNERIHRFEFEVRDLCRTLPGLTTASDPFDAVRELDRLMDAERAQYQRHRMLSDTLEKAREADAIGKRDLTEARAKLQAILSVIGADTMEHAAQRLAVSDERTAFERRRQEAEAELRDAGDGYSIEDLLAETARSPADEDAARIEAARLAHKQANEAAQTAAEEASSLRRSMEQSAENTDVNAAAADQQAAIALLKRTLEEALLYHTASLLLSRALDTVEQSGGSEMLRRLSAIFQELTCGFYANVASDQDDNGKAGLVMIQRDHPEERQHIEQLSEGTRDQLFLALRVAAIENHIDSAEPLPFIGDDILQTFDDDRALAALRVLADLSERTQVVILTHHRHIQDLAARLPQGCVFSCQREKLEVKA